MNCSIPPLKLAAIIPAAGRGLRMGASRPKQFIEIGGSPILLRSARAFLESPSVAKVLLVVPEDYFDAARSLVAAFNREAQAAGRRTWPEEAMEVLVGGKERQDSVWNGLRGVPEECGWVAIHDGARPFLSPELLDRAFRAALDTGAAIAALPATDTVKRVRDAAVVETVPREDLWLVQTPQIFRKDLIVRAYEEAISNGWAATDDAAFVERLGHPVAVVPGDSENIKITRPEDLARAEWMLARRSSPGPA